MKLNRVRPVRVAAIALLGMVTMGCATKRYVRSTVAPLDAKVSQIDKRTADKDKELAGGIEGLDNDLSRTKEHLSDTDAKAAAANENAQRAEGKAVKAGLTADEAHTLADKGLNRSNLLQQAIEEQDKLQLRTEKAVLFKLNSSELTPQGKAILDEMASQVSSLDRYVVELEGFTDRTGNRALNLDLSQRRAEAVARYFTVKHNVPLRRVHILGLGQESPAADNRTRAGRAQNRRVDVRIYVPGSGALEQLEKQTASAETPSRQMAQKVSGQ
ncbi:MAG: OmpA family protein [Acidobacteriales bacterium]|nr:OmpA family protein [Terriglobales bacterium]